MKASSAKHYDHHHHHNSRECVSHTSASYGNATTARALARAENRIINVRGATTPQEERLDSVETLKPPQFHYVCRLAKVLILDIVASLPAQRLYHATRIHETKGVTSYTQAAAGSGPFIEASLFWQSAKQLDVRVVKPRHFMALQLCCPPSVRPPPTTTGAVRDSETSGSDHKFAMRWRRQARRGLRAARCREVGALRCGVSQGGHGLTSTALKLG